MIDLKRNTRKELVEAKGIRTRQSSIYTPNKTGDFKISRSKFSDFLTCPRCFYLDRVKGLDAPGTPGWTLNETTDLLLKKEFDVCRAQQSPHRIFRKFGLDHLVPFQHEDIDKWRDSLHYGLSVRFQDTNIILSGGIDDVWQDTRNGQLVVADYKSQANNKRLDPMSYLGDAYHEGYKIQMDFYGYLLSGMGFMVSAMSYFLVCNADRNANQFAGKLDFNEVLIPYQWNSEWIPKRVNEMIDLLNSDDAPEGNFSCKNCAYARQRTHFDAPRTA